MGRRVRPSGDDYTHARGKLAALVRHGNADAEEIAAARAELAEAEPDHRSRVLAEHVRKVVDRAPPLTPAQRERIAAVLRSPSDAAGGAA